jgi:hypothetical protein
MWSPNYLTYFRHHGELHKRVMPIAVGQLVDASQRTLESPASKTTCVILSCAHCPLVSCTLTSGRRRFCCGKLMHYAAPSVSGHTPAQARDLLNSKELGISVLQLVSATLLQIMYTPGS